MMKACVAQSVLLVLLTSLALPTYAKPTEVSKLGYSAVASGQRASMMVAARGGFASTTLGPKKDVPISCAKP